ncbi:MAG: hypothetical protein GY769_03275 [bacterium]|nr:hypothetical protein [bacterium]
MRYFVDPRLPDSEVATLHRVLQSVGYRQTEGDDWDFYWDGVVPSGDFFRALAPGQRVNCFPALDAFSVKSDLHDNIVESDRVAGKIFRRIHPHSFSMPDDYKAWRAQAKLDPDQLWLLKPKALGGGREIELIREPDTVPRDHKWMVQEYISRPHLLSGLKYGLRFFPLITALDPLLCYLHTDGVCKMASRPYTLDPASLDDRFVHVANASLQHRHQEVARATDLHGYRNQLRELSIDDEKLFSEIRAAILRMLLALREQALLENRAVRCRLDGCYLLLGVDVLVDEDLRPWIIECNVNPALGVGPYDRAATEIVTAKDRIVTDLLSLVGVGRGAVPDIGPDPTSWRVRTEHELAGARGWERLWPTTDSDRFVPCLPLLRPLDRALASDACAGIAPSEPALRPAEHLQATPLGDGLVVYDCTPNRLYALNASAAAVWLGLAEGIEPASLIDELSEAVVEVTGPSIAGEVWDLLVAWAQRGLLAGFERNAESSSESDDPSSREAAPLTVLGRRRGGLLIIPTSGCGLEETAPIELPPVSGRRLVLLASAAGGRATLRLGSPAAALDALLTAPEARTALSSAGAASLATWLDRAEIFELAAPDGASGEGGRLLNLLASSE